VKTTDRRACPVCGTLFPDGSESCPVCALRGALKSDMSSAAAASSEPELRFEHYAVLKNADGTSMELGRGAMGVTYKAFDIQLQCPVALKIINAQLNCSPKSVFLIVGQRPGSRCSMRSLFSSKRFNSIRSLRSPIVRWVRLKIASTTTASALISDAPWETRPSMPLFV
jgi:hypothetical protein